MLQSNFESRCFIYINLWPPYLRVLSNNKSTWDLWSYTWKISMIFVLRGKLRKILWRITLCHRDSSKVARHSFKKWLKCYCQHCRIRKQTHYVFDSRRGAGSCIKIGISNKLLAWIKISHGCVWPQFSLTGAHHPLCLATMFKTVRIIPTFPFLSIPKKKKSLARLPCLNSLSHVCVLHAGRM